LTTQRPHRREVAHDQRRIRRRRQSNRDVKPLVDHVNVALAHREIDLHLRMLGEELGYNRCNELDDVGRGIDARRQIGFMLR
jgi:hypothetical protein